MKVTQLKFRLFDKKENRFWMEGKGWDLYSLVCSYAEQIGMPERFELLQYTGVNDKNNREIYESDIVIGRSHGGGKHFTAEIRFVKGEFITFVKEWECQCSLGSWAIELEVIGNIYEENKH